MYPRISMFFAIAVGLLIADGQRAWSAPKAINQGRNSHAEVAPADGQRDRSAPKAINHGRNSHVEVPPGYFLLRMVTGLNFPTGIAFSADRIWVSEAGFLPGIPPTVKEVDFDGSAQVILSAAMLAPGRLMGPLTDVTYHNGWLWISHRQTGVNGWRVGAISKFNPANPAGSFTTVVSNLPSSGDHHSDEIIFDRSGRGYFSQGSATNSSVVGADNWIITGWLQNFPTFHDFAAKTLVLNGTSFRTQSPFPLDPTASMMTAPFMPFGSGPVAPGTIIPAATPSSPQNGIIAGNGAVYSFDPMATNAASTLRLEGWGLRNPFGIGIDPMMPSKLFVANNGTDVRGLENAAGNFILHGSRPIANDWDDLFVLDIGGREEFFGWPDFFHEPKTGNVLPVTDPLFCASSATSIPCPPFVLEEAFRKSLTVERAFAQFELHSSANKFDFSTDKKFKFEGDIFVAETGSFEHSGAQTFAGYKVVRVDRRTGQVSDFIVNRGRTPEELFEPESFNKPIDVKFMDEFMFIVDFGVFEPDLGIQQANTGKVWIVSHGMGSVRSKPVDVTPQLQIGATGFRLNRTTGRFAQTLKLTNMSAQSIEGPFSLVFDNLSTNAMPFSPSGSTSALAPFGSPFVTVNVGLDSILSPGESASIIVEFENSNNQAITYTNRALAGPGTR